MKSFTHTHDECHKPEEPKKFPLLNNISSKFEVKPILKHPLCSNQIPQIDPFKINLIDLYKEKTVKRASSALNQHELDALKKNPNINLIEFFKEKDFKNNNSENPISSEINSSSYNSSSLYNSPRKTKKSLTFSITLYPSLNAENLINNVKRKKMTANNILHNKKVSTVLGHIPKAKASLMINVYDKINEYILINENYTFNYITSLYSKF